MKPVFGNREGKEGKEDREARKDQEQPSASNMNMVTREEAEAMAIRAAEHATERVLEKRKKGRKKDDDDNDDNDDGDKSSVISSKTVNELKNIAGVFNALKDFSSNPLQKAIENKVGDVAAGVVERAFNPSPSQDNKDIWDKLMNSQIGAAFGAGLGQRAPELVSMLTDKFGPKKVGSWIDNTMAEYGRGGGRGGYGPGLSPGGGVGGGVPGAGPTERELISALDPNNPEHVAAYAKSQADIPIEVARGMLLIHQEAFAKQMQQRGQGYVHPGYGQQPGVDRVDSADRVDTLRYPGQKPGAIVQDDVTRDINKDNLARDINKDNLEVKIEEGALTPNDTSDVGHDIDQPVVTNETIVNDEVVVTPNDNNESRESGTPGTIADYLRQLNDYVGSLREMVETQNNAIFKLQSELNEMKGQDQGQVKVEEAKIEEVKVDESVKVEPQIPIIPESDTVVEPKNVEKINTGLCKKCIKIKPLRDETRICDDCKAKMKTK